MAEHVPVYHFNINAEGGYVGAAIVGMGFAGFEIWNAWGRQMDITTVFHVCLFIVSAFHLIRHFPFAVRTEFLRFGNGGITFRDFGFVPWNNIEKIGLSDEGIAFLFMSPETITIKNNYFRRISYNGNKVLMILRTSKISLDATTIAIADDIFLQYAIYLAPTRGFSQSTPPEEILARIDEEKRAIKFFEKYEDIFASFSTPVTS